VLRFFRCNVLQWAIHGNCGETLKNKENGYGKFNDLFGRAFCVPFGEKSNVKMGRLRKDGGGGSFTEES
jgi:hypothetical protein